MASTLRAILTRVQTDLAGIDGTTPYTNDLSATGVVKIGRPTKQPAQLGVYVGAPEVDSSVHTTSQLGTFRRELRIPISGFIGATQVTPQNRLLLAADLLNDILLALEADRTLNSKVIDSEVTAALLEGPNNEGRGDVECVLRAYYQPTTGI